MSVLVGYISIAGSIPLIDTQWQASFMREKRETYKRKRVERERRELKRSKKDTKKEIS